MESGGHENQSQLLLLDSIVAARVEGGIWSCAETNRNQTKKKKKSIFCLSFQSLAFLSMKTNREKADHGEM